MEQLLLTIIDFFLKPFTQRFLKEIRENNMVMQVLHLYSENKFVPIRFWDSPFIEVERIVPKKGVIVDLGCGEGIFTNFLGVSSPIRKVIGIEIDSKRLQEANKDIANVSFKKGDATHIALPSCDAIILFHLLHHLHLYEEQEVVIKNCLRSLKEKGKLIIVEVDKKPTFKYLISWFTDCFIVPWLFEKRFYTPVHYRSRYEWLKIIKELGYSCTVTSAEKSKPFTHIIIVCKKSGRVRIH